MIILFNLKLDNTFATAVNLHLQVSERNTMELYKINTLQSI